MMHLSLLRRIGNDSMRRNTSYQAITVIDLWKKVLQGVDPTTTSTEHEIIKDMASAAITLNKGRFQNLIPDVAVASFRRYYSTLGLDEKSRLFDNLINVFGVDEKEVNKAILYWQGVTNRRGTGTGTGTTTNTTEEAVLRAADCVYQSSQPLYSRLWAPLAQQADGISFLVNLRADLLDCIATAPAGAGHLRSMSENLRRALAGWFSVGLLSLERISWEHSTAAVLEQIAAEERVHSIAGGWEELKQRLDPANRRVFAWTHPSLPGEPLVALHVALCQEELPQSMDAILKSSSTLSHATATTSGGGGAVTDPRIEEAPRVKTRPTSACFYSISTMKKGLAGVDLGNNLIKRAVKELSTELPSLKTMGTLSPLPGFASWLHVMIKQNKKNGALLLRQEEEENVLSKSGEASFSSLLRTLADVGFSETSEDVVALLQPILLRLAAQYLLQEKHREKAFDPVANFHLRNGASVYRLNWGADTSASGMSRSFGIMVNYLYDMDKVEENNRRYLETGEISVSDSAKALLL